MHVEPAASADWTAITGLLISAELPLAGLEHQFPEAYAVVRHEGQIVAVAGLQRFECYGLLRSVVVEARYRSNGLGRALVAERLRAAGAAGLDAVYLLSTGAAAWFERLGFELTKREATPGQLLASPEFAGVCPTSADCLIARPLIARPPVGLSR